MKALVEYLARALVRNPEEVTVEEEHLGDRVILRVHVSDEDKGRIIGREGRIANAIRSLVYVAATRAGVRATVDID